ncbi:MAG TPA: hypothetical protein VJ875_25235 [Pyrinomonadaceae bacterium]|nr:hypothetical protein [Pyrinomonadaceae bacterium]
MQDNPNTENYTQPFLTEREDWELAFEPYDGEPSAALNLGFNLAVLRIELDSLLIKSQPVIDALDLAMEVLFPFTEFHDAAFDLFIRLTEGKLSKDEEQMLNALGIKF